VKQLYDDAFYAGIAPGSRTSADRLLSIYARYASVESFLDVGCGGGSWLDAAQQVFGLAPGRLTGLDGVYARSSHSDKRFKFVYQDLQQSIQVLDEKFDLLVCVEVAEHLRPTRADSLVSDLVIHADSIIFGAAIPNQGGTGHVNEQWPDYWAERFARHGYIQLDLFRAELWNVRDVMGWYSQNTCLYVKADSNAHRELMNRGAFDRPSLPVRVVHPAVFSLAACETAGVRRLMRAWPAAAMRTIRSLLRIRS
jgi:SAM-dependent methyltransferase